MAKVGESMQASIKIGGELAPSWKGSITKVQERLAGVTQQSKKLSAEQVKLAETIKKASRAGENVKDLRAEYERLTRQIGVATHQQGMLNRELSRAERLERSRERWRGRGVKALRGTGSGIKKGALYGATGLIGGGLGAMFLASPMMRNMETAEKAGLARSYGVGYSTYSAWDSLGKQMGLNGENIGDLFEEYRNKVWDYENGERKSGAVKDVFPKLGIKAGEFSGLSNQEQVERLFDKLLAVKDEQMAAGMGDALFGGEANKILTYMRLTGKSYRELMEEQKRYNMVTKEGAEGAVIGNVAFSNFRTVLSSGIDEIGGLLGEELAPKVRQLSDDLAGWFKGGGITSIKGFIRDDFIPSAAYFVRGLWTVGRVIYGLAKKLSWLIPDENDDRRNVLKSLARMGSVDIARSTAEGNGQGEWFEQQLRDHPDLPERVKAAYRETRGYFSDDEETFNKLMAPYTGTDKGQTGEQFVKQLQGMFDEKTDGGDGRSLSALAYTPGAAGGVGINKTYQIKAEFNITQKEGEDGLQFAQRVNQGFQGLDFGSRGSMTDTSNAWSDL
ncbi:hypothetical protein [Klebsiella pneumoniae]|uniref:hypothetical protein n=1 Tax=Klebsiella pneumoniae TaxID=573 RepID=UPI0035A24E43|nr:hypothetical protein [Klebsiella pneumoniae]